MRRIGIVGGSGFALLAMAVGLLGAETLVNGNPVPYRARKGWRRPKSDNRPAKANIGRDRKKYLAKGLRP